MPKITVTKDERSKSESRQTKNAIVEGSAWNKI